MLSSEVEKKLGLCKWFFYYFPEYLIILNKIPVVPPKLGRVKDGDKNSTFRSNLLITNAIFIDNPWLHN